MRSWDDVNARARGLQSRFLGRARLERLAEAASLMELSNGLERSGYPMERAARAASPEALERAVRRRSQTQMTLLARWCGERTRMLAVLFEDEDRRSLRALVRGALAGAPREERLSALMPTPTLPEEALKELARLSSVSQIAATLSVWRNPYGVALRAEAARARPDLFQLELAVNRLFGERALTGARKGGRILRAFAEESLDLENAVAATVLARSETEGDPEACFLEGGRRLDRDTFLKAAGSREPGALLAPAFAETSFERAFATDADQLERSVFRLRLRELVSRSRLEPLTPLPLLAFLFRLRAEAIDLRTLIWTRALGATTGPPGFELVSV